MTLYHTAEMQLNFADIDAAFPRLPEREPWLFDDTGLLLVRRMSYGNGQNNQIFDDPAWEQIKATIFTLDGFNDILLEGQDTYPYLVVGGKEESYLVAAGFERSHFYLSNPRSQEQEEFKVVLGGQASNYPTDLCVSQEMVVKAVWSFTKQGVLDTGLRWVRNI